jgi:pimeloyl-ACP methyl ester carboxylesterase
MLGAVTALLDDLGLERPHVAGNSLGGRLALEAAVAGRAASATGLSPAGFWRNEREATMARATFKVMEAAGGRLQRYAPALSRHTAGRALLYGVTVSRPSRVPAEQAAGDMTAFLGAHDALKAILAELGPFTGQVPVSVRSRSPGEPRTGCSGRRRCCWPRRGCRRHGSGRCRAAGTCR